MLLLASLPDQRAHTGADRHPEDRDEEQQAEQETPEHPPGRAAARARAVVRGDLILAVGMALNRRHRVCLDDQVRTQILDLSHRLKRGCLIWVANCDQLCHTPLPHS